MWCSGDARIFATHKTQGLLMINPSLYTMKFMTSEITCSQEFASLKKCPHAGFNHISVKEEKCPLSSCASRRTRHLKAGIMATQLASRKRLTIEPDKKNMAMLQNCPTQNSELLYSVDIRAFIFASVLSLRAVL